VTTNAPLGVGQGGQGYSYDSGALTQRGAADVSAGAAEYQLKVWVSGISSVQQDVRGATLNAVVELTWTDPRLRWNASHYPVKHFQYFPVMYTDRVFLHLDRGD